VRFEFSLVQLEFRRTDQGGGMSKASVFARQIAALSLLLLASAAAAQEGGQAPAAAPAYPADGCLKRREAVAVVTSGKAVPLRQVRGAAEGAARGEMINAELCTRSGQLVYVVTVLSGSGKVVYVSLDAASGRLLNMR
jgi:uncharacterized membrane protein YkoI